MYQFPERKFYYYSPKGSGVNKYIEAAESEGLLQIIETEFYHYKVPVHDRSFFHLTPDKIKSDSEKSLAANNPMYMRSSIRITERCCRQLKNKEFNLPQMPDENPVVAMPNVFGMGIDLKKALKWLKTKFSG